MPCPRACGADDIGEKGSDAQLKLSKNLRRSKFIGFLNKGSCIVSERKQSTFRLPFINTSDLLGYHRGGGVQVCVYYSPSRVPQGYMGPVPANRWLISIYLHQYQSVGFLRWRHYIFAPIGQCNLWNDTAGGHSICCTACPSWRYPRLPPPPHHGHQCHLQTSSV